MQSRYGVPGVRDPERGTIDRVNDLKRNVSVRLTVLHRRLRSAFDRHVSDTSITRSQWSMIAAVAQRPGSSQRSIAELLEMSEASAGRLIDRLCADGLLERRDCEGDRRARSVYLAEAANPLLLKLGEAARASDERVYHGFSDDELRDLVGYLDRIYANLNSD